ncbi:Lrp/AsnC family transcriptional regulator [Streptomyces sp. ODS28]|uniref:Lrp/AsnC family transcriptional regulator n=1 Tax=Streptomyces sp. ODS28 TaxID=3136688 RepID=UPI0031EC0CA5
MLSETDLALIEALQVQPRASWARVAEATGVDATTAARRWRRLSGQGLAWLTAYPLQRDFTVGYLDLACDPERLEEITDTLCGWSYVFHLERMTGDHQIFLGVAAADLAALDALVTARLPGLPGVRSVRAAVGTRIYREGGDWLPHALSSSQRSRLVTRSAGGPRPAPDALREDDRPLLRALGADGRRSCADLARLCGLSETTVRRRLGRMMRSRQLRFRCDVTQPLAGWPVSAAYRIGVPPQELDAAARALAALPHTRLCAAVTGTHNLLLLVWLRSPGECAPFEEQLLRRCPRAEIGRRELTLRAAKRMGRLLGADGRANGHVPLGLWAPG